MAYGPHGKLKDRWWTTTPTTGPTGTATIWVGNLFEVQVAGRLCGVSCYRKAQTPAFAPIVIVWQVNGPLLAAIALKDENIPAARWQNAWLKPYVRLQTGVDYNIAALYYLGQFFRNNGALSSAVTHSNITYDSSFTTTAAYPPAVSTTASTNANAVDVLFLPD